MLTNLNRLEGVSDIEQKQNPSFRQFRVGLYNLPCKEGGEKPGREIVPEDTCRMVFCLDGGLKCCVLRDGRKSDCIVLPGQCGLQYCPEACHFATCAHETPAKSLEFLFPCHALRSMLGERQYPPELAVERGELICLVRETTPAMRQSIDWMTSTMMCTDTCHLFLLAKALELLWLFLGSGESLWGARLKKSDQAAVSRARRILENNLETPPAIDVLASQVGMSASKLKQLFPKAFGVPPYVYLRKMRMEKALYLLSQGAMNVTEAAMAVGYSSISHFTKAFTGQFGVKPSQVLNQRGAAKAQRALRLGQ